MNKNVYMILVGLLATMFGSCNFSRNNVRVVEQGDTVRVYNNIAYGGKARNVFDVYLPGGADKRDENALILFLHGG